MNDEHTAEPEAPDLETLELEDRGGRRRRRPIGALSLLVVAFTVFGVYALGSDDGSSPVDTQTIPTIGGAAGTDQAPEFAVDLLSGGSFRLSRHLADDGRPVILNLWASWCSPCRAEMPELDAFSAANPDVYLLGVAVDDDPAKARDFAAQIGVSYDLAIDEDDAVGTRYPSPGLPATFFIDQGGKVVRIVFGAVTQDQLEDLVAALFD